MELKEVIGLEAVDKNPNGDYEGRVSGANNYTYILPAGKVCFLRGDFKWTAIIEKIDPKNKKVYVSQINWLYMLNIIKHLYSSDIIIKKRYPGRLTLAILRDSLSSQEISKEDIKKLSTAIGEKIVIKKSKEEIKMPEEIKPVKPVKSIDDDKEKKLIDYVMNTNNRVEIEKSGYRFFITVALGKSNISFIRVESLNRRFEYFYQQYQTDNEEEKKQVVTAAAKIFLSLISRGKPS